MHVSQTVSDISNTTRPAQPSTATPSVYSVVQSPLASHFNKCSAKCKSCIQNSLAVFWITDLRCMLILRSRSLSISRLSLSLLNVVSGTTHWARYIQLDSAFRMLIDFFFLVLFYIFIIIIKIIIIICVGAITCTECCYIIIIITSIFQQKKMLLLSLENLSVCTQWFSSHFIF